jgi:phosphoglycolate phosphatase
MKPEGIKHIIWDWNGTLVDDAQRCVDLLNGIRAKRAMPSISLESYRGLFDFPVREYYRRIGFDLQKDSFESLSNEFISGYIASRKNLPLQAGTLDALNFFKQRKLPQCILSATQSETLKQTLKEYGIDKYFNTVMGLDHHYADGKAHLGEVWLKMHTINKDHVLFIGDTLHDVEVANKMGIECILVSTGHHSKERLETSQKTVLDNLQELIDLF